MDYANLSLAFSAGILAFLSPCALPMLPSYVAYYLNVETAENKLQKSLIFGLANVFGFITVFLVVGLVPSFALNQLSSSVIILTPIVGVILIILGILTGWSNVLNRIPRINLKAPEKAGIRSFYLYGVGYAAASLTCSLSIFLLIVLQSITASGPLDIMLLFFVYGLGAGALMIPLTVALSYSKKFIYQRLMEYMPYMKKVSGVILIVAGVYMLLYNA